MAEGALLASDPKANGLLSAVFNADPKAGTSGLAAADPNDGISDLGVDSAPNDKPSGFATDGDAKVGTSGLIIEEPNAGTSGFPIDDPKVGTAGLTAGEEQNEVVSVLGGAPKLNKFEGVDVGNEVAVEIEPPKLDVAETVGTAGFPNTNAVAGAGSVALAGAPKVEVAEAEAAAIPNENPPLTSSVLGAAGAGVLFGAVEPNTGAGADVDARDPNVGGAVEEPKFKPVEGALAVFVVADGAGTPNENVDVGAEDVVAGAALEIEVGLIPKLKVLSFLSTSSLSGAVAPNPKEKFDDG